MTYTIRFWSRDVESTFLYRSSMGLDLETLSFSHRKPLKTMGVACVHLDNVNRVKYTPADRTFG